MGQICINTEGSYRCQLSDNNINIDNNNIDDSINDNVLNTTRFDPYITTTTTTTTTTKTTTETPSESQQSPICISGYVMNEITRRCEG